ncbi:MAG: hypothetical protein ACOC7W_03545 [Desulfosalsimonas sp.]
MNTVKWLGILSFLTGLVLSGFHAIGLLMERPEGFYTKGLIEYLGEDRLDWIEGLPFEALISSMDFVVNSPLYVPLIGGGLILLVLHGLFAKG